MGKMGLLETLCEKLELEVSTQSGRWPRILRRLVILLLVVLVAAALDSQDPINTLISYDPPRGDS